MLLIIHHALEIIRKDAAPHYSFPPAKTKTVAAARTAMAMDGLALRSFGVPVDGMGGSTVSMVG